MKKIFNYEINGKNYTITAESYGNRSGFAHSATLFNSNGDEITTTKIQYYNRTWERYEFESVIFAVVNSALDTIYDRELFWYKKEKSVIRLTEKKKAEFLVELQKNNYYNELKALKEKI